MSIGLELSGPIRETMKVLEARGVRFQSPIHEDEAGSFALFEDPDGNPLYLAQLNWSHVEKGEGQYQHA